MTPKQIPVSDLSKDVVVAMPDAALNRLGQLNLALFLAALNGHLEPEERVLGLSGVTGSQRLDTLVIAKPMRDYPWLRHHKSETAVTRHLARSCRQSPQGRGLGGNVFGRSRRAGATKPWFGRSSRRGARTHHRCRRDGHRDLCLVWNRIGL